MAPSSPPALTAGVWPGQGTIRCHVVCGFCKQLQTQCSISCERPPRTAPERPTSETSAEVTAVVFTTEHLLLKAEFKTRNQLVPSTIAVESAAWVPRSSAGHLWKRWPSRPPSRSWFPSDTLLYPSPTSSNRHLFRLGTSLPHHQEEKQSQHDSIALSVKFSFQQGGGVSLGILILNSLTLGRKQD